MGLVGSGISIRDRCRFGVAILVAPAVLALTSLWERAVRAIAPGFSLFTVGSVDNLAHFVAAACGTS